MSTFKTKAILRSPRHLKTHEPQRNKIINEGRGKANGKHHDCHTSMIQHIYIKLNKTFFWFGKIIVCVSQTTNGDLHALGWLGVRALLLCLQTRRASGSTSFHFCGSTQNYFKVKHAIGLSQVHLLFSLFLCASN